jgi:hypothetical protein
MQTGLSVYLRNQKSASPVLLQPYHSTETSKETWLTVYHDIITSYNASPLGRHLGTLDLRMICRRLRGMCGDHANNEKALSQAWKELKHDLLLTELGEKRLMELDGQLDELHKISQGWVWRKFEDAGGFDAYMRLPAEERATRDLACVHAMTRELGAEELAKLDEADQRLLTAWIWTGSMIPSYFENNSTELNVNYLLHVFQCCSEAKLQRK